ncbi:MAG: bifunctional oligoribonuclease/PAP phosphatase NrnA [Candidatus Rokubacteria bacterium]|nr:bifunctional oligoribonuclease/PAP phosphatase NrnA [Candidatus Rokubacteria bacterium]
MTEPLSAPPPALLDVLARPAGQEALLLGHVHPDADVLGTLLGLGLALEGAGWPVTFAGPDPVPEVLGFLPGATRWEVWSAAPRTFDVIALTDCPDPFRTNGLLEQARATGARVLNIDHHPDNRRYGTVNWIDPSAAAAGEMIHDLLGALGLAITPEIALALFTALHTDTGSFRYSNTTARTFRIAAELTAAGAQPALVSDRLYQQRPPGTLHQLGQVLERLTVSDGGQVAWLTVPQGLVSESFMAAEDVVSYPRSLRGVRVALVFREEAPGVVKVSLRGKGEVRVNRIAARFGGGGHENAAGCSVAGTLDEAVAAVLGAVREALPSPAR